MTSHSELDKVESVRATCPSDYVDAPVDRAEGIETSIEQLKAIVELSRMFKIVGSVESPDPAMADNGKGQIMCYPVGDVHIDMSAGQYNLYGVLALRPERMLQMLNGIRAVEIPF